MKTTGGLLLLALATGLTGCGGKTIEPPQPLTVAEWKAMPRQEKYTPETLERLKQGDPRLETPEGWEAFSRTTLKTARKKDFAGRPNRTPHTGAPK